MKKAFITVGMLFGDEGKGICTAALCKKYNAELVVRYSGGAQCGHNVETTDGLHHEFHMFGSGTFQNIPTLFTKDAILDLSVLQLEADSLRTKKVYNPLALIYASRNCLLTTPYHKALNRLKEMSRTKRHGSCGFGVGETVALSLENADLALRISDIQVYDSDHLVNKLEAIRNRCFHEAKTLSLDFGIPEIREEYDQLIYSGGFLAFVARYYIDVISKIKVLNFFQIADLINAKNVIVFEGAQGILLDQDYGTFPYNTWTTTTSKNAKEFLDEISWAGEREVIGVTRTYATRHGVGPFVTEDSSLRLEDKHNKTNTWQQDFRIGYLDLVALQYACKIDGNIDSLAITHADMLQNAENGWKVCLEYPNFELQEPLGLTLELQARQSSLLMDLKPSYVNFRSCDVLELISKTLDKPIRMTSYGSTTEDQIILNIKNNRPITVSAVV